MNPVRFNFEYPRRLRAAVIGCGGHTVRNILPTLRYAPIDLVGACDINADRASSVARLFGASAAYTKYADMLARENPEIVLIVLDYDEEGHPRYPQIAIDAMRAGAHVWMEKPPAHRVDEVLRMMDVSRDTGRFVGVGFKKMFAAANVKAKEIVQREEFGAISTITARYPQGLPRIADRGDDARMVGFLDHIVHPYSVLRFFAGSIDWLRVERHELTGASVTTIRFVGGALGVLHLSAGQSHASPLERTEIVGEGANLVVENGLRISYYRRGDSALGYGRSGSAFDSDSAAALHWEPEFSLGQLYNSGLFLMGYAPEIIAFCDCVLADRAPEVGNLSDALELITVFEAYRRPDGQRVAIAPQKSG